MTMRPSDRLLTNIHQPSPKRQRSISRSATSTNHVGPHKKLTSFQNRTPPPNDHSTTSNTSSSTKQSPWQHKPAWLKQNPPKDVTASEHFVSRNNDHKVTLSRIPPITLGHKRPEQATVAGNIRTQATATSKSLASPYSNPGTFKVAAAQSLRFDPTTPSSSSSLQTTARPKSNVPIPRPDVHISHSNGSRTRDPASHITSQASTSANRHGHLGRFATGIVIRATPPLPKHVRSAVHAKVSPALDRSQPSKLVINIPPSLEKRRRHDMIAKLKQDTTFAKTYAHEVESVLGLTGFSKVFPIAVDEDFLHRVAQPKKRVVDRSKTIPDLGIASRDKLTASSRPHKYVHPKEQAKAILTARFAEPFDPPVTFANVVNERRLNGKFQFVSSYILRKGVKTTGTPSMQSCRCEAGCDISCRCLYNKFDDQYGKCEQQVESYRRRADGLVVLKDSYIDQLYERAEISECNDDCSCDATCINRVVQHGRTIPLEIFQTSRCGFGVRSTAKLYRGQFIDLYLGEVITESELNRREDAKGEGATSYIFSLDRFANQQCYHVDGENFGTAMRFVNHSCNPNCRTFTVLRHRTSKQLHYVAFFAIKDIEAGTEITIDYSPQTALQEPGEALKHEDDEVVKCLCGEPNCRGLLWRPGRERRTKKKSLNEGGT